MAVTKLNLPRNGEVCGKRRFYSEKAARDLLINLEQSEKVNGKYKEGYLNVYWCLMCEAWHVGHSVQLDPPVPVSNGLGSKMRKNLDGPQN